MKIHSTADIASKRACVLVVGESGRGKTYLARTLPESETLIVSLEAGLLSLKGTNIATVEVKTKQELDEVAKYLSSSDCKYKYIYIDSLTELNQMILAELKLDPKLSDAKNGFVLWGRYTELVTAYIKFFRDLPQCVVITCLSATEEDGMVKVPVFNFPGASIKQNIKAWFDIVLFYEIFEDENKNKVRKLISSDEEHPLSKDRSGCLKKYEDPNLLAIFNKILNKGE